MTKMWKCALALILTAALMLPFLPMLGTDVYAADGYGIWVGGVEITDANRADVLGALDAGATVRFDPDTSILTLENADITGVENAVHENAGIYSTKRLEISLVGKNTVRAAETASAKNLSGITVLGHLTVSGEGSLSVFAGEATQNSEGIYANGMTLEGGRLDVTASAATVDSAAVMVRGTLAVSGGFLRATAGDSIQSYGVFADELVVSAGGITAFSGNSDAGISIAIGVTGDTAITGGSVLGVSGSAAESYGIFTEEGALEISGTTVRASAGVGTTVEASISAADITVTDATVLLGAADTAIVASNALTLNTTKLYGASEKYVAGTTLSLTPAGESALVIITNDTNKNFHSVYVGGIPVTDYSKDDVLGDGTVRYDAETRTLTLTNATVDGLRTSGVGSMGIVALGDLRIELVGENLVTAAKTIAGSGMLSVGVYAWSLRDSASVTFTGDGSLAVIAQDGESVSAALYGETFTVESGKITAVAGASDCDESVGIYASKVTVSGGRVEASGDTAALYSPVLTVADGARLKNTNEDYTAGSTDLLTQKDASLPAVILFAKGTLGVTVKDQTIASGGTVSSTLDDVTLDASGLVDGDHVASVALGADGHTLTLLSIVILDTAGNDVTDEYDVTVTDGACHTPGSAVSNGDGTHTYVCTDPSCGKTFENEACGGGVTTCFARAKCLICDGFYGPAPAHRYKWSSDAETHRMQCSACGDVKDEGAHVWDAGKVTLEPTESAEGEKTFTCTVCAHTKTELIDKLPTSSSGGETTEDPEWASGETTTDPEWASGETTTDPEWGEGETTTDPEGEGTTTEDTGEKDPSKFSWWWLLLLLVVAGGTTGTVIAVRRKASGI